MQFLCSVMHTDLDSLKLYISYCYKKINKTNLISKQINFISRLNKLLITCANVMTCHPKSPVMPPKRPENLLILNLQAFTQRNQSQISLPRLIRLRNSSRNVNISWNVYFHVTWRDRHDGVECLHCRRTSERPVGLKTPLKKGSKFK